MRSYARRRVKQQFRKHKETSGKELADVQKYVRLFHSFIIDTVGGVGGGWVGGGASACMHAYFIIYIGHDRPIDAPRDFFFIFNTNK